MTRVPTPPLKALDKCANPECGHDKADHLPRCTNGEIGPPYQYCKCESFHQTAPKKEVKT